MDYTVYYQVDTGFVYLTHKFKITSRLLSDALQNWCNVCVEQNIHGIFYKIENEPSVPGKGQLHIVHSKYGMYGIRITNLECYQKDRNPYLLKLRAKREMLGLSIDQMIQYTGVGQYKDLEAGRRKCSLDDYARFMTVLEDIENGELV